jgi:hypothetical protein
MQDLTIMKMKLKNVYKNLFFILPTEGAADGTSVGSLVGTH